MQRTGEKPGAGTYTCVSCGNKVTLEDHSNRLPLCTTCNCIAFK